MSKEMTSSDEVHLTPYESLSREEQAAIQRAIAKAKKDPFGTTQLELKKPILIKLEVKPLKRWLCFLAPNGSDFRQDSTSFTLISVSVTLSAVAVAGATFEYYDCDLYYRNVFLQKLVESKLIMTNHENMHVKHVQVRA
jgi:hypothetical protein